MVKNKSKRKRNLIIYHIVGTPPPPIGPPKNWVTWAGVWNFLLERGDKPEKGGADVEMGGGCHFLLL